MSVYYININGRPLAVPNKIKRGFFMTKYKNGICYDVIHNPDAVQNLVFIHGSGCNRKFLRALAKKLPEYNCYLPDLPDHGKSNFLNCNRAEDYVDAMADFVKDMENVTIIGHSLGGTICLGIAAKSISSVKKCMIISSGAKFDKLDERIHTMVKRQKINWGYLIKCLGSLTCPAVLLDLLNFENPKIILKDFAIDITLNLEYTLKDIRIPTLITVSKEDILTLPEYSEKMRKGIKESRLVYFTGCRHMLPIVKRKEISELIRNFVTA